MAAMVASQHSGMWQRRSSQVMQIASTGVPIMVPSSATPTTGPFQQPNYMEFSMNMFPSSAPNVVPFTTGVSGFSLGNMNQYQAPQNYDIGYSPAGQSVYTTAPTELRSAIPHVQEARNAVPSINRSPSVKVEAQSPVQQNRTFSDGDEASKGQANSTLGGASFSTDVDCLMKEIQAKQKKPQLEEPRAHISQPTADGGKKAVKRYQCSIPGCNKRFYQKTHLEIHTRAHTGVKPFACKEPSCGQRFSQLGNLKVRLSAVP